MLSGKGGSLAGVIAAVEKLIATTDASTKIIPGHGPLANRADLVAYLDMLSFANIRLGELKKEGKTLEEDIAESPMIDYEIDWAGGLFTSDKWVGLLYDSL